MMSILIITIINAFVLVMTRDEPCNPPSGKPSCVCDTRNGIIDLTSISYSDGNPYFQEYQTDNPNQQYYYNPCHNFYTGNTECSDGNTAICQEYQTDTEAIDVSCGTASSEQMVNRNGDYYLLYTRGTSTEQGERSSEVKLICDPSADTPLFTAYGDSEVQLLYKFDLTTKCACPGGCTDSPPPTDPGSPPPTDPDTSPQTDPDTPTTDKSGVVIDGGKGTTVSIIEIVLIILISAALILCFIVGAIVLISLSLRRRVQISFQ